MKREMKGGDGETEGGRGKREEKGREKERGGREGRWEARDRGETRGGNREAERKMYFHFLFIFIIFSFSIRQQRKYAHLIVILRHDMTPRYETDNRNLHR